MDSTLGFQHNPFVNAAKQIRLLQILHSFVEEPTSADSSVINVSLTTWNLDETPEYAALSYTWGDATDGSLVSVQNEGFLSVTKNCAYALWQLSRQRHEYFWIDAICIDQMDDEERSAQVNIMGDIFSSAYCVFTSLGGNLSSSVPDAVQISQVAPLDDGFEAVGKWLNSLDTESCRLLLEGMVSIATREYWNRAWIVQEFVQAKEVFILVGSFVLPWKVLTRLVSCLSSRWPGSAQLQWRSDLQATLRSSSLPKTGRFRRTPGRSETGTLNRKALWDCMPMVAGRHCRDIRDRLFSILSIVDWSGHQGSLKADYSITRVQLAIRAVAHLRPLERDIETVLSILDLDKTDPELLAWAQSIDCIDTRALSLFTGDWNDFLNHGSNTRWQDLPDIEVTFGGPNSRGQANIVNNRLVLQYSTARISDGNLARYREQDPKQTGVLTKGSIILSTRLNLKDSDWKKPSILLVPHGAGRYRVMGQTLSKVADSTSVAMYNGSITISFPFTPEAAIAWSLTHGFKASSTWDRRQAVLI